MGIPFPFATQYGPFFSSIFVFIGATIGKHNTRLSARFSLGIVFIGLMVHMVEIFLTNAAHGISLASHSFVLGTLAYGTGVALFAIAEDNFGARYNIHLLGKLVLGVFVSHIFLMKVLNTFGIWPSNGILRVVLLLFVSILFTKVLF
jgi:surface polysaccharide O-acyltransferase-like enzyme